MISSDERYTPQGLVDVACAFGGGRIALDPCAPMHNPTGAHRIVCLPANGLEANWSLLASGGLTFVNPPYSRGQLRLWVAKCVRENGEADVESIALIPSDLGSQAGAMAARTADAVCFPKGRLSFLSPEGPIKTGAKQPSVLVY